MQSIEIYEWIIGIVNSCTNQFQIDSASNIIELFKQKFPDEEDRYVQLQMEMNVKFNEIHSILK